MRKLLSGKNSVLDALDNHLPIKKLYLAKHLSRKIDPNIEVIILPNIKLNAIINTNHQGFIAELKEYNYFNLDVIKKDQPKKILVIDHIHDPHNFGAILRTANAAGVEHIIIPKDRQVEVTPTVLKVSSGGYVGIKIIRVSSIANAIIHLKQNGFWIYVSSFEDATPIEDVTFNYPLAMIIGNEGSGVSRPVLKQSDQNLYIKMNGTVQSLNVSVATGILLFSIKE